MKRIINLFILCGIVLLGVCGCSNNKITNDKEINKNEEVKEDIDIKENETDIIDNDTNEDINIDNKEDTKPTISNNNSNNTSTTNDEKQEITTEEINKKIVVCSIKQESSYYYGITTHTTTFENNTIIHDKIYIEKHFEDGYKAEEDTWTISNIKAIENNTKVGISGNAYIENNITYLTINYDIKANPDLIELITKHTEYNDFLNHMTNNNGYFCTTK